MEDDDHYYSYAAPLLVVGIVAVAVPALFILRYVSQTTRSPRASREAKVIKMA
jgi:hypothetical protein